MHGPNAVWRHLRHGYHESRLSHPGATYLTFDALVPISRLLNEQFGIPVSDTDIGMSSNIVLDLRALWGSVERWHMPVACSLPSSCDHG
jgi:hypothetical protein